MTEIKPTNENSVSKEEIRHYREYYRDESIEQGNKRIRKQAQKLVPPEKNLSAAVMLALDRRKQAEYIIDIQPCYYDRARNWWLWEHRYSKWTRVDEVDILNAVERQADGISTVNSKEKSEILEALRQISRLTAPIPLNPSWLQFRHEIIDVITGERFKATPDYFATNPIPWELQEDNLRDTPTMDKLFTEWVGEDNVQKLYEIIAYCAIPDYPLHRIFCFIGSGMNGKSCFLNLLRNFIGPENCVSTELEDLIKNRFERVKLHKKLVCLMGETNFNRMDKTSMIKKLSGGDLIGFEYKNKDCFDEINYAKLLIATNNLPSTNDKSIGFYRRWMIIDFPNEFSEKEDVLMQIPAEEYEALALKCSFILKDLLEEREFTNEGSIEDRKELYESKSDFLQAFLDLTTVEYLDGYITKSEFSKRFESWRKENRHREMSDTTLGLSMKSKGITTSKKHFEWVNDGKGGQLRVWNGIKWND